MRGMAARPPYFASGFAKSIRDIVDYYDRRYYMEMTEQEKEDLTNLMSVL
jgi:cytochrome c peroxidase